MLKSNFKIMLISTFLVGIYSCSQGNGNPLDPVLGIDSSKDPTTTLPGVCKSNAGYCTSYIGSDFNDGTVQGLCTNDNYSTGLCAVVNSAGTCSINPSTTKETKIIYYLNSFTTQAATADCTTKGGFYSP